MQMFTFSSNIHQKYLTDEKRKRSGQTMPIPQMMNFSFREQFDEILMRTYIVITQYVNLLIHQIIVFSFITKSIVRL